MEQLKRGTRCASKTVNGLVRVPYRKKIPLRSREGSEYFHLCEVDVLEFIDEDKTKTRAISRHRPRTSASLSESFDLATRGTGNSPRSSRSTYCAYFSGVTSSSWQRLTKFNKSLRNCPTFAARTK